MGQTTSLTIFINISFIHSFTATIYDSAGHSIVTYMPRITTGVANLLFCSKPKLTVLSYTISRAGYPGTTLVYHQTILHHAFLRYSLQICRGSPFRAAVLQLGGPGPVGADTKI